MTKPLKTNHFYRPHEKNLGAYKIMGAESLASIETLREWFTVDFKTGLIYWKKYGSNRSTKGKALGGLAGKGYLRLAFQGRSYAVHRIIWALFHGEWPTEQVDHINHKKTDNRIVNLQELDNRSNCQKKTIHKRKKPGCYLDRTCTSKNKWKAQIFVGGRQIHIGRFETEALAHAAYLKAVACV